MTAEMKAAVLTGRQEIEIQTLPIPDVASGTILLKILACGVCGSDIRIFNNGHSRVAYPAITGHEIAAEVVETGPGVTSFQAGDRLSLGADVPCGECEWCQNGLGNCCEKNFAIGHQFPGGFAHYCLLSPMTVLYGPLRAIPAGLDVELAALGEPLACCINGLERVNFAPGRSAIILGAGPIGIMLAQAARAFGSPLVILSDLDPERLVLARMAGADAYLNATGEELVSQVMSITRGRGADVVFTACPSPAAQEDALRIVATRGAVNLFGGLPASARPIQLLSNLIHYKEITLTGSHGSTPRQHALAVDLIASGRINLSGLITHRFPLSAIRQAFQTVQSRTGLKVMVNPND
jgi:L-iditol 2-dehydrogenase